MHYYCTLLQIKSATGPCSSVQCRHHTACKAVLTARRLVSLHLSRRAVLCDVVRRALHTTTVLAPPASWLRLLLLLLLACRTDVYTATPDAHLINQPSAIPTAARPPFSVCVPVRVAPIKQLIASPFLPCSVPLCSVLCCGSAALPTTTTSYAETAAASFHFISHC